MNDTAKTPAAAGWLERHPAVAPLAAAAVFLALFQAFFVASIYASVNIGIATAGKESEVRLD